ncbi:hypothetical protein AB0M28_30215 [Streptomyces sp. NPDC051940]|uniref:hypothetical protein n=1 Tax=Streptomyces sp. NPDC051940 TaxID=3155675 RepID=UPI003415ED1C
MTVAVSALACAVAAWGVRDGDSRTLRWLVVAAAAVAVCGAVLSRRQDRTASLKIKEAVGARQREELKHEEDVAELETELDESRALRRELERRLTSRTGELERLRSEHAALLRRYATSETERAGVLESRRLLAIEAREEPKALPAAAGDRLASGAPTPATYLRASVALRNLARSAERQGRGGKGAAREDFDYFGLGRTPQEGAPQPERADQDPAPAPAAKDGAPEGQDVEAAASVEDATPAPAEDATPAAQDAEPATQDAEAAAAGPELPQQSQPRDDRRQKGAISRVIDLEAAS